MPRNAMNHALRLFIIVSVLMLAFPVGVSGQSASPGLNAPKPPTVSYHSETGKVRFITAEPGQALSQEPGFRAGDAPESAARFFLARYGAQFGLKDPARELSLMRVRAQEGGRSAVRYQQNYEGVPVFGGEMIVHVDGAGRGLAAMGEVLPDLKLSVTPAVAATDAAQTAITVAAKAHKFDPAAGSASAPALWIYNPALVGAPGLRQNRLAWRTEVTAAERLDVRELVLVDAQTGGVLLHFNQVDAFLSRKVYDNGNNGNLGLPGVLKRSEGQAATGILDVDNAYDYAGATYAFYSTVHGRDSIDNKGMELIQTVRYCDPDYSCPYDNAFWNGEQMVYGQGYASADDVVAHELSHGVTEHESNLFYFMQSGAINEAFSDIWGELIDLSYTNGRDTDTPTVRWQVGENIPVIGAIRSMSNPPAFGDPDSTASSDYTCDWGDGGGVHTNSGVVNKAAYLMVDGDDFGGYSVQGIGAQKTAHIFYAAQTGVLTPGSDFQDLHDGLAYACSSLIGSYGITAGDCDNVRKALAAVKMNLQPSGCEVTDAPFCDAAGFTSAFQGSLNGWTALNGAWSANSEYAVTQGLADSYVSMSRTSPYSDFEYFTSITRTGCAACASGLIVRGVPTLTGSNNRWSQGFFFAINRNGQYKVEHWTPTGVTVLQPWTTHPDIDTGASANALMVKSEAAQMEFHINDVLVWTGMAFTDSGTHVGVAMERDAASTGNELNVDWLIQNGGTPIAKFIDGFEKGLWSWTQSTAYSAADAWVIDPWGYSATGLKAVFGENYSHRSDYALQMGAPILIPTGAPVFMRFNHYFAIEELYDGGVVEYSANGGPWTDAASLFVDRGYTAALMTSDVNTNPLAGRLAFTGFTNGYTSSRLDLSSLAGMSVRFRFRIGSDDSARYDGWDIDDVRIYSCSPATYRYTRLPVSWR